MKFKLKYIVFAVMLCLPLTTVPVNAVADITLNTISSDFSDLSQTDKLKILKAINEAKQNTHTDPLINATDVKSWVGTGTIIGTELAGLAKAVGTPMMKFIESPVGTIATVILVVKLMGDEFSTIIGSALIFFGVFPVWVYFFRKMCY